jgi:hypothetical protein
MGETAPNAVLEKAIERLFILPLWCLKKTLDIYKI